MSVLAAVVPMSGNVAPSPPPGWLCELFSGAGPGSAPFVYFRVRGPRRAWLALSSKTSTGTAVVFDAVSERLVVLFDVYGRPWHGAGRTGTWRRFDLGELFSLGVGNREWIRTALLGAGRGLPRWSEHVTLRQLLLGPASIGADEATVSRLTRAVVSGVAIPRPGVLPPPDVLACRLADPILVPDRDAFEAGVYVPPLTPADPPAELRRIRVLADGSVQFPSLIAAIETLGTPYSIAASPAPNPASLERYCRRRGIGDAGSAFGHTVEWMSASADPAREAPADPRVVPGPAAFELFQHATVGMLERWRTRIVAMLEEVVEPTVYTVVAHGVHNGRRRVSVTSPTDSAPAPAPGFLPVADLNGDAFFNVRQTNLREVQFVPVGPGTRLDRGAGAERTVRHLLALDGPEDEDGAVHERFAFPAGGRGIVKKLPLCMMAAFCDGDKPVPLKDGRRLQLASVLNALRRRLPEQHRFYRTALERAVFPQGALQRDRMKAVLSRTSAPPLLRVGVCAGCRLNTAEGCFAHLQDGRSEFPTDASIRTVVDLLFAVRTANLSRLDRLARVKELQAAARAARTRPAPDGPLAGGTRPKRPHIELI